MADDKRRALLMDALAAGAGPFLAAEAVASVALDRDPDYGTHVVDGTVEFSGPCGCAWNGRTCPHCGSDGGTRTAEAQLSHVQRCHAASVGVDRD